jgi:hypothetical protein
MARARSTSSSTVSNSACSQLSHWYFSPCQVSRQTTTSDLPMYLDRLAAAAPASEAAASAVGFLWASSESLSGAAVIRILRLPWKVSIP